jgi:hypothetical protein
VIGRRNNALISRQNPHADALDRRTPQAQPVLLFSGGRDSTLAAARTTEQGESLHLVTVVAEHLCGIDAVERRVDELTGSLGPKSEWWVVRQPRSSQSFGQAFSRTCLPCQHDYLLVGANLLRSLKSDRLLLGYAGYQSDWPEQSPEALEILRSLASEFEIRIDFPVYDLKTKEQTIDELEARNLSAQSLEQKCIRQINNVKLGREELSEHLVNWERWLRYNFARVSELEIEVVSRTAIGGVNG